MSERYTYEWDGSSDAYMIHGGSARQEIGQWYESEDELNELLNAAALGRQVREAAAAMGVEPGRVGEILRNVDKLHGTAHAWRSGGMSCGQAMRLVDDTLARLSPAPERDAAPTRCLNCDNDIETGGCRCPLQGSPS